MPLSKQETLDIITMSDTEKAADAPPGGHNEDETLVDMPADPDAHLTEEQKAAVVSPVCPAPFSHRHIGASPFLSRLCTNMTCILRVVWSPRGLCCLGDGNVMLTDLLLRTASCFCVWILPSSPG